MRRKNFAEMNLEESEAIKQIMSRLLWKVSERRPLTRGSQAALPNIDHFLPVHNLASLEDLAIRLADLDQRSNGGTHARYSL